MAKTRIKMNDPTNHPTTVEDKIKEMNDNPSKEIKKNGGESDKDQKADNQNKEKINESQTKNSGKDNKEQKTEKKDNVSGKEPEKPKKKKRPAAVSLKDKSELFKQIIDVALECEGLESKIKELESKNTVLEDQGKKLAEENKSLTREIKEGEERYQAKIDEVAHLNAVIAQKNEVINIVKADKNESSQEYKNALAASLRSHYVDYKELKELVSNDDELGESLVEILNGIFGILEKNGIIIK